ncbi:MAG TPA: thiamine phosphate synthase [Ferrovibrio sp.]|uniref:thiamine phosphate synthase n=1 Tax=Ferrovibrio sp. TaxID=1917215 RepID=UPI002B4AC076|nr:thiamine phosphate synthase [Ferrovibrio sp.]HLT77291.1 thiamine phosphate synthase [Ferrovibrio sp.]
MQHPPAATKPKLPHRWLVTDAARLPDPLPAAARLSRGEGVLFRHYEWPRAEREALAQELAALCRRRGLRLLVAGDPGLALRCGADGLHLPEAMLVRAAGIAARHPRWLVTAAAHGEAAIVRAARGGVDAVLISPVFPTGSHPGAVGLGVLRFAQLAAAARRRGLGVYALGGITRQTAQRLVRIPKNGTAAIAGMAAAGNQTSV